jgi:septal ring factor EnvC (AmiA/AmiB activator)
VVIDLFAVLEQKLEMVLGQLVNLTESNAALQKAVAQKEQALKDAEGALEKISREREVVRQRIDKILKRLETLGIGESA